MLRARKHLLSAMGDLAARDFDERMLSHLREMSPAHFRALSDDDARVVLSLGQERAARYGLTSERGIRYYVDTMFLFGSFFDEDPLLPWAAQCLSRAGHEPEDATIDRLKERAWEEVSAQKPEQATLLENGAALLVAELRRVRAEPNEPLLEVFVAPLIQRAFDRLIALLPVKAERAGAQRAREAVAAGVDEANRLGLTTVRGAALLTETRFLLGCGVARDPLLPALSRAVRDASIPSAAERVDSVYSLLLDQLRFWGSAS